MKLFAALILYLGMITLGFSANFTKKLNYKQVAKINHYIKTELVKELENFDLHVTVLGGSYKNKKLNQIHMLVYYENSDQIVSSLIKIKLNKNSMSLKIQTETDGQDFFEGFRAKYVLKFLRKLLKKKRSIIIIPFDNYQVKFSAKKIKKNNFIVKAKFIKKDENATAINSFRFSVLADSESKFFFGKTIIKLNQKDKSVRVVKKALTYVINSILKGKAPNAKKIKKYKKQLRKIMKKALGVFGGILTL